MRSGAEGGSSVPVWIVQGVSMSLVSRGAGPRDAGGPRRVASFLSIMLCLQS